VRILVLYGTSEGQTAKIARRLADRLEAIGHEVSLINANRQPPALTADRFDATIVAARVHAGRYPRRILGFIRANRPTLNRLPNAFLSVSMSAALQAPGDQVRLNGYISNFIGRTGWMPAQVYHVAGARLYTRHNAVSRWILGIVDRHRCDTNRDHEFTDWDAVDRLAMTFLDSIGSVPAASSSPREPATATPSVPDSKRSLLT